MILFIKALLLLVSESVALSDKRDCAQHVQVTEANIVSTIHNTRDNDTSIDAHFIISHLSYGHSQ